MKACIQKWGNSLALRIPRSFAAEARLSQDTPVELAIVDGKLVISPIEPPRYNLEELLAQVTDENIHSEIDFGPAVGKEIW